MIKSKRLISADCSRTNAISCPHHQIWLYEKLLQEPICCPNFQCLHVRNIKNAISVILHLCQMDWRVVKKTEWKYISNCSYLHPSTSVCLILNPLATVLQDYNTYFLCVFCCWLSIIWDVLNWIFHGKSLLGIYWFLWKDLNWLKAYFILAYVYKFINMRSITRQELCVMCASFQVILFFQHRVS